jgi:hypothetical protein
MALLLDSGFLQARDFALVAPAMATLDRGLATWLSFHQGFKDTCDKYPPATIEFLYAVTNMVPPGRSGSVARQANSVGSIFVGGSKYAGTADCGA